MWLLNFLPEYFFHAIVTLGATGVLICAAPLPFPFKGYINLVCVALLSFGLYTEGGIAERKVWEEKVAEQKIEIERLKAESEIVTTKVVTKYVDRYTVVTEKADEIIRQVPVYITEKADASCAVTNGFVVLHDAAARNTVPEAPGKANDEAAGVKISEVGSTIAENYKKYHQLKIQLESLQEWLREQEKVYKK